jgi:hypothetical protein
MSRPRTALSLLLVLPTLAEAQGDPKPRPMPRGVVVQASIERYPVSGATVDQITYALRGALDQEGGFLGHWFVDWRYSYRFGENVSAKAGCRTQNVRVDMREARSVSDRLQERHRKLDADSKHGATAGARWPPIPPVP